MKTKTYTNGPYRLVLDSTQIYPNDPGAGTPAMLYGPDHQTATFWCALSTGECGDGWEIPRNVMNWLDRLTPTVEKFLEVHGA